MKRRVRRLVGMTGVVAVAAGTVLSSSVAPSQAAAQAVYVGGAGCSDSNTGAQASPVCTIGKGVALAAATPGAVVQVNPGTYAEQVTIPASGTAAQPFTVAAVTPGTVTVTGGVHGFVATGRSYVIIDGFNVTNTLAEGFDLSASNNLTISRNTVSGAGGQIQGRNASGFLLNGVTASTLTADHADHNSLHGFELTGATTGVALTGGEASFNAEGWQRGATGIDVRAAGNSIVGNVLHDNEDAGLRFAPGGDSGTAAANVVFDNGDAGIDAVNVASGAITGNTVFHNCSTGISVQGQSAKFTIENNIAVDNAVYPAYNNITCSRRGGNIGVFDAAAAGTKLDYNQVFLTAASGAEYAWGSTSYPMLSGFQTAVAGQGVHDLQADPKFASATTNPADAATWNLRLIEGSPAIDSADSGAPGEQTTDADGNVRVDDPNVPNSGVGPRTFDDRGAYEFMPPAVVGGPSAALSVTPASGVVPLSVTADASGSTAGAAAIASYSFDFGDGSATAKTGPLTHAIAGHTYSTPGTYTVTVTVKDASGLPGSTTQTVTVSPAGPNAALTVPSPSGSAPQAVTADASGSTKGTAAIISYTFDFGDGSAKVGPQPGATATHTYSSNGLFIVAVTVTDANNLTSTATQTITVGPAVAPAAALKLSPASGSVPLNVTADATGSKAGSSSSLSYSFDFGDGSAAVGPQAAATATHSYTKAGTFTVKVTVTDSNNLTATASQTETVSNVPPTAALAVTPAAGSVPLSVTADASGSKAGTSSTVTYSFDFGDGSAVVGPQAAATATHAYTKAGTFAVKVTVTDGNNLASTATSQVSASYAAPTAALTVIPTTGIPLSVTADASGTKAGSSSTLSYSFDFGDGSAVVGPQAAATATHTFTSAGTYTVKVTVTDGNNLSSIKTAQVAANAAPNAALTTTPTSGTAPLSVTADASGTKAGSSTALSYSFDFGDGSAVIGPQAAATATHAYTKAGTFTVKVTVTDGNNLTSTATGQVTVSYAAPTAALAVNPTSGAAPLAVTANAGASKQGSGTITSYGFNFGDGSAVVGPQAAATAAHSFTKAGTYIVTVTVTDANNLTSTASTQVTVTNAPPAAALLVNPGAGSVPLTVTADASGTKAGSSSTLSYTFNFGDGSSAVGPQATATAAHAYTAIGTYTVTVSVTDGNNLTSSATQQVAALAGPVGRWKLNEDATVSSASDLSGHGNTASPTYSGVTWGPDGSAVFSSGGRGPGDLQTAVPLLDNTAPFTISAWAWIDPTSGSGTIVGEDGANAGAFMIYFDPLDGAAGTWNFAMPQDDTVAASWDMTTTAAGNTRGVWHHIVATYNGNDTMALWVDGTKADSTPHTGDYVNLGPTTIGRDWYGSPNSYWVGKIKNVSIYKDILTDAQIQNLNSTAWLNLPSTAAFWPLNDGAKSSVADSSGNNHAGGLTGGVSLGTDHNGSATFNGIDGRITTAGAILDTSKSFTVTAWANLAAATGFQDVITQDGQQASGFYLQYETPDNAWAFTRCSADVANCAGARVHAPTAPVVGSWTHLAATFDATSGAMTLYVNGQAVASGSDTTPFNTTGKLAIGRGLYNGANTDWFNGSIADVQAYQRVLSASEIGTMGGTGVHMASVVRAVGPSAQLASAPVAAALGQAAIGLDVSHSKPGTAPITDYAFDYGDGTPVAYQTQPAATHTYAKSGAYTVKVTVKDAKGAVSTATKQVFVQPSRGIAYAGRVASAVGVAGAAGEVLPVTRAVGDKDTLIVSILLAGSTSGAVTVSDSRQNVYTVLSDVTSPGGQRTLIAAAIGVKPLSGKDTIKVSCPAGARREITVDEFSGITAASARASNAGPAGGKHFASNTAASAPAGTTLLFTAVGASAAAPSTADAGWKTLPALAQAADRLSTAFQVVTRPGAYASTGATNGAWSAVLVTFQ